MLALFLPHIAKMICTAPRLFALLGDGILSSCSFPRAGAAIDRCSLKYFKTHFVFAPVALRKPIPVPESGMVDRPMPIVNNFIHGGLRNRFPRLKMLLNRHRGS